MEICWICSCDLKDDYMLLPHLDDYFHDSIPLSKNTFIIKKVGSFEFLYYTCCQPCIDKYLNKKNYMFKYLQQRELMGK